MVRDRYAAHMACLPCRALLDQGFNADVPPGRGIPTPIPSSKRTVLLAAGSAVFAMVSMPGAIARRAFGLVAASRERQGIPKIRNRKAIRRGSAQASQPSGENAMANLAIA